MRKQSVSTSRDVARAANVSTATVSHVFNDTRPVSAATRQAVLDAARRLNPFDPDMTGFLGLFKVTCGQAAEGEALLRRSLALDDSYPGVAAVTLAFILSQRGEQAEALAVLDQMPSPSNMEPQYLMVRAIVMARQGDVAAGQAHWRKR